MKLRKRPSNSRLKRPIKSFRSPIHAQKVDLFHPISDDLYHWLLALPWRPFLLLTTLFYLFVNLIFALIYLTAGDGIANVSPGSFKDAFFFSIQTLSTVGYGSMYPESLYAQILVTIEMWIGLLCLTILTGLMFARFSRPTARVMFSNVAVVCPYNGISTLMFRAANRRDNRILEAQIQVTLLRNEMSEEGLQLRRFYDLSLVRSQTPIFALSWLVMHPIDENSPLYGMALSDLEVTNAEIWITLTGLDETFSQTIHSRYGYQCANLLWNHRFVDIFSRSQQGETYIDLTHFHDVVSLDESSIRERQ